MLFLYGSLLDPAVLGRVAGLKGLAQKLVPARAAGWRRVFLRATPYPTLVKDDRSVVDGALFRVSPAVLARLSAYEGSDYALVPVMAVTARSAVRARAWIAPPWRADPSRDWP